MKKLVALFTLILGVLLLRIAPFSVAADDGAGEWKLASDATVDGVTGPQNYKTYTFNLNVHGNKFIGRYVGNVAGNSHPNSIFTGETQMAGETKIVNFQEYDMDYHVSYVGKEVAPNTYEGTWYSSNAQSGSFRLQAKKK
ncbi:MAG TPA: hypothetical protein VGX03_14995 [Candidatus Binatia bacterium]|jgi:hypothetical protein|nr:hypothetical protein [Candidatus Binatia bacterium]